MINYKKHDLNYGDGAVTNQPTDQPTASIYAWFQVQIYTYVFCLAVISDKVK